MDLEADSQQKAKRNWILTAVGVVHLVAGIALLPLSLFLMVLLPLPVLLLLAGVRLARPKTATSRLTVITERFLLLLSFLLTLYGLFMIKGQAASASHGGGLMGGLGEITAGTGITFFLLALGTLAALSRAARNGSGSSMRDHQTDPAPVPGNNPSGSGHRGA